jgi:TolB-like protein/Tfp pilus assembly protein PilF
VAGESESKPAGALFLSYASEDVAAAERITIALRSVGLEVWFDKSELRGGDAWDQKIRRQIRDCALFVPIISAHSQGRLEGYFRLEWKLAVDRSHLMANERAFLLPVVIDDTRDAVAVVPDRFRETQWTRLPGGETPPAFTERVKHLLSGEGSTAGPLGGNPGPALPRMHSSSSRGWARALPAVVAAAILAVVASVAIKRPWISSPAGAPALAAPASIAVLPLANESGEASQQYFSDGISEDLITALSQFPGLKVIGRSSAFQFRDSKEDSHSIGAKLGVAHLLEGSVRRSGEMVRVSAELIDAADGTTQWSERYDRPFKDLFALQDDITRAVAGALKTKLLPGEHVVEQSERPPSGNLEAYNAVLQGGFYGARGTDTDDRKAIEFYTKAIALDSHYAFAWSNLAGVWTDLGSEALEGAPAQEAYAKAREAANRALALSPDLAAAHVARGILLEDADFDWLEAEAEFRRALALAPNDGMAKFNLGVQLATFGEVEQAIELTRQAVATDPLRASWYNWLATYFSGLNRLTEAEHAIRRAIELQPGAGSFHRKLAIIEVQRGNAQAALAAAQQEPDEDWRDIALALARQIGTDQRAADAALKTLIEKDAGSAPFQIAQVYALRKDAKATFEWLDRAWSGRDSGIQYLLYDPFILRFKGDPRFAALCRKVGLPTPAQIEHRT